MLTRDQFIDYVLAGGGVAGPVRSTRETRDDDALPEGMDGFDEVETEPIAVGAARESFARRLLEHSDFGLPAVLARERVIRGEDAVARHLPERVAYWEKTAKRPYHILLFETSLTHRDVLAVPAFKRRAFSHLDVVEDALASFVQEALNGFQKGGEGVTSEVRRGIREETLCIVSILDAREVKPDSTDAQEREPVRLVCFGTENSKTSGLETFYISEQVRRWEPQLAREHLGLLHERQFKKLATEDWQEAFTTTEERKKAEELLEICTGETPTESQIQEAMLDLLDSIAKSFGLRKKPRAQRRLQAFALPAEHDIGIDPETREKSHQGNNPFNGVTLRDEQSRLLGYIVYPLNTKKDADTLRAYLAAHNRFHNVLVVYPDKGQATIELWQGNEQLVGRLRKGQGHKDAAEVVALLSRFFVVSKARVKNPTELAQELAHRARYLRRLALKLLENDNAPELTKLHEDFKKALIHDQTMDQFADAFAQSLTYSLLTARWVSGTHGQRSGDRFTRKAAVQELAIGSRFLKEMFEAIFTVEYTDERGRLLWLVDDIADLLDRVDVGKVFESDGTDLAADPVIHFYEPFLAEYDATIRAKRGVYYTPRPVVQYIVRSVDALLRSELGLEDGLADVSTWAEVVARHPGLTIPEGANPDDDCVKILDPATGTGTFLVEVIDVIHRTMTRRWGEEGADVNTKWNEYVPKHLLPRLHAYELLVAPYAVAHLKIGLKLHETGYRFRSNERVRVYLTNALEPSSDQLALDVVPAIAHEAEAVNGVKRKECYSVVIGNPPYLRASSNKGAFITQLMEPYKAPVRAEKNIQPLSDDYIKFICLAQYHLKTTGFGVLGMITNNTFLSGRIHRGMRKSIVDTFDTLRILDLHGSGNVDFLGDAGIGDENVFDIRQGVSVLLATTGASAGNTTEHAELVGARTQKYSTLRRADVAYAVLDPHEPWFLLIPRAVEDGDAYGQFVSLDSLFHFHSVSGKPGDDSHLVYLEKGDVVSGLREFTRSIEHNPMTKLTEAGRNLVARGLRERFLDSAVIEYAYRPFDNRYTYYDDSIWTRPVGRLYSCIDGRPVLLATKIVKDPSYSHVFVSRIFADVIFLSNTSSVNCYSFPRKLPNSGELLDSKSPAKENFISGAIACEPPIPNASADEVFAYVYCILHSPEYRARYYENLQMDFPRVPKICSEPLFTKLAALGGELIELHLMESQTLERRDSKYVGSPSEVGRVVWMDDVVWLNAPTAQKGKPAKPGTVGFHGVPEEVWNFRIGGYQVCEKWLKDRKGRTLSEGDIAHYQKIIVAISETIRIMAEIDDVIEAHGGWPGAFATTPDGDTA